MINLRYTVYDLSTGRICWTGYCAVGDLPHQGGEGLAVLVGQIDGDTWYCPNGVQTPRPELSFNKTSIAADGMDQAIMKMMSGDYTVRIDGEEHQSSGDLVFVSITSGTYQIEIDRFPYLPFVGEITVE